MPRKPWSARCWRSSRSANLREVRCRSTASARTLDGNEIEAWTRADDAPVDTRDVAIRTEAAGDGAAELGHDHLAGGEPHGDATAVAELVGLPRERACAKRKPRVEHTHVMRGRNGAPELDAGRICGDGPGLEPTAIGADGWQTAG